MTDAPDKGGRPRLEIDFGQLEELCKIQCTKRECAAVLGVSEDTLDRRVREETGEGFAAFHRKHIEFGQASLRRAQFAKAIKGHPTMLIWLGKQYLGQRDKHEVESTVRDVTAEQAAVEQSMDALLERATPEQLELLQDLFAGGVENEPALIEPTVPRTTAH